MQKTLSEPLSIEGVTYRPVKIEIGDNDAKNRWLRVTINEGKNREIRRIFEYFGLQINRLIRIQYGPFELADLKLGSVCQVQQIPQKLLEKIN